MASLIADRRLYLTADKSEVVEEGDLRAAFLLAGKGRQVGPDEVARYKLSHDGEGHVVLPGQDEPEEKEAPKPEDKMAAAPENKALDAEPEAKDYADMGYQDLRRLASDLDLDVSGRPKKDELIEALEAHDDD